MSKEEIWMPVLGYEKLYMVSNHARVRSLDRCVRGGRSGVKLKKGKIIKQVLTNGYYKVALSKNGRATGFFVHRLIATAFILNIDNKPYINHKDGVKTNNTISNLEWCTAKENTNHLYHVLGYSLPPESRERSNEYQRKRAIKLRKPIKCVEDNAVFDSVKKAADTYGLTRRGIRWLIQNNKTSKTGKTFCYAG